MKTNLHHAHLFASDLNKSLRFYQEMFGAEILFDLEVAGARNVMIAIGTSKINFYDQPPKDQKRGVVHHLGIETDDLEALLAHMKSKGFEFRKPIKNLGVLKYVMAEGPDHILFELFEVIKDKLPKDQYKLISTFHID
ncbi:MAG: VOC family protein [Promethearchaeota archaeon]